MTATRAQINEMAAAAREEMRDRAEYLEKLAGTLRWMAKDYEPGYTVAELARAAYELGYTDAPDLVDPLDNMIRVSIRQLNMLVDVCNDEYEGVAYEANTGRCWECQGSGFYPVRWGDPLQPCDVCNGTGEPKEAD